MKACPYCGKELPMEAQFCPYCMKKLVEEQPVAATPIKKPFPLWVVIVGVVAVIAIVVGVVFATGGTSQSSGGVTGGTTTTTNQTTTTTKQQIQLADRLLSASDYHEEIKKLHPETASYTLVETGGADKIYTDTGSTTNYSGTCIIQENGGYTFIKKSGDRQYLVYYTNKERLVVTVPNSMGTVDDAIADATAILKGYPGGLTTKQLCEKFEAEGETKVHQGTVNSTTTTEYTDTIHGVKYTIMKAPTHATVTLEFDSSYVYTVTEEDNRTEDAEEVTTTTGSTNAVSPKKATLDDVKKAVNGFLENIVGVTEDMLITESEAKPSDDGSAVYGLTFMQNKCSVIVGERGGYVSSIIAYAYPGQFYIEGTNTETDAAALATGVVLLPLLPCSEEEDVSKLSTAILRCTPKTVTKDGVSYEEYVYEDGAWKFTLLLNNEVFMATAVALESDNTANDNSTTESEADVTSSSKNTSATKKSTATTKKSTTTTTKKASTTTQKPTSTQSGSEDACASGHNWEEITKTVHHKEEGHYEWVVVKEESRWYDCPACDKKFEKEDADNLQAYYQHFDSEHADSQESFLRDSYTSGAIPEKQEKRWIVDQEAYDETVVMGYKCSACGETK